MSPLIKETGIFPERQSESETADYVGNFDAGDRARLVSQGAFNYIGQIASVLSSIILVPFMLLRLGAEAYGFWIVALATPAFAAGIDNALYLSITRETALHRDAERVIDKPTSAFLSAACGAYAVFGLLCGVLIVATGMQMAPHLHLSAAIQTATPTIFTAVAIAFAAGRAVTFSNAVLAGFQRFGTINAISVGAMLVRFVGFALLLQFHCSLAAIAICYAIVSIAECLIATWFSYRLGALRADSSLFQWKLLNRISEFGISSFLTTLLQNVWWFSPPIMLGFFTGGTSATTSLYAGQRPCFIVSELNWRGAEVLFSASAAEEGRGGDKTYADIIVFGTKCVLSVAMPFCIGLVILAPVLVHVWLRIARPETVIVMQLTSIGVIADALWVGPLHALWGRGMARQVLFITAAMTALLLFLNASLIPRFGVASVALAFTLSAWLGAIITTVYAAREFKYSWPRFLLCSFSDVALPSASLIAFTLVVRAFFPDHPLLLLFVAAIGGGIVYAMLFWIQQRFLKNSFNPLSLLFRNWKRS